MIGNTTFISFNDIGHYGDASRLIQFFRVHLRETIKRDNWQLKKLNKSGRLPHISPTFLIINDPSFPDMEPQIITKKGEIIHLPPIEIVASNEPVTAQ